MTTLGGAVPGKWITSKFPRQSAPRTTCLPTGQSWVSGSIGPGRAVRPPGDSSCSADRSPPPPVVQPTEAHSEAGGSSNRRAVIAGLRAPAVEHRARARPRLECFLLHPQDHPTRLTGEETEAQRHEGTSPRSRGWRVSPGSVTPELEAISHLSRLQSQPPAQSLGGLILLTESLIE